MAESNQINLSELLPVGATLQMGKYSIEHHLASGGFGNTYVVINTKFDERMAMKEFFMRGVSERNDHSTVSVSNAANQQSFDSQRDKFNKEARRLRKLHNEHIVQVHDLFDENDTSYYVMDYVDGESLSQRLKRTGKPLSEAEALDVFNQVLDALDSVHSEGIWHLDLKPSNIMVDANGVVKVIDFGASKQMSAGDGYTTTTTAMCYTPGYAPPEQIDQKMELIGPWTDLYALGGTLYTLLSCKQPPTVSELQDDDAFQYPAGVSARTRQLVQWMMTLRRAGRPQSVQQVREFLAGNREAPVKQAPVAESFDESTVFGGNEEPQQPKKSKKSKISQISQNSQDSHSSQNVQDSRVAQDSLSSIENGKKQWWKSGKGLGIIIAAITLLGIVGWFAFGTDKTQSYYDQGKALYDKKEYVEAVQFFKKAADLNHAEAQYKLGVCYEKGRGVDMNMEKAVEWYRKSAEQGQAKAQYNLALCYEKGKGVEKNDEQAKQLYKKAVLNLKDAAEQGDDEAQRLIGLCYEFGRGEEKNMEKAVEWYRKSAEQENAGAQRNLGLCYEFGRGVEKNMEKAVEWYRKAAEQGYAEAQYNLGVCYYNGTGVAQDYKQAVEWWRKAADQGNANAQSNLGVCYEKGLGVEKDMKKAVELYRKSADQGDALAQVNLGVCYEKGLGVEKDMKKAVELYRKSADQGNATGQKCLGVCYYNGTGVAQDYKQAVEWWRKAADQGNANAQSNLGVCYEKGIGVTKDLKQAVSLYRKAADQGNDGGQFNLGVCYEKGIGVTKDLKQAVSLYRKAADQGYAVAKQALQQLIRR